MILNVDERRLLDGLVPSPLASVVDNALSFLDSNLGGSTKSPPLPQPVQKPSPPSSTGGDSSPSHGGGGGGGSKGGGLPPTNDGGSSSNGGSSSSNGGGSSSNGGGSSSNGGGSSSNGGSSSSNGGSSASSSGDSLSSTGGGSSSPPSSGASSSSTGGGPSPPGSDGSSSSTGGSFSAANGSGGTPSPGEGDSSSSSSTTTPGTPSTQTDPSIGTSQPSAGLTGDRTLSQGSTNQNSTSTSLANIPVADVQSMSLPNSIQKSVISGSPAPSTETSRPSATNGPNGTGTNPNLGSSALANPHHQLSSGGIAAIITVILLLFIALHITVYILRRRFKLQRYEHQKKWWSGPIRTSQTYEDLVDAQLVPDSRTQVSSSLAANIDHSESESEDHSTTYDIAPLPPAMTEMGRGNASRPALVINIFDKRNNDLDEKRISIASAGSDRSQYVIITTNPDSLVDTPMSVRPFSPSESFAFPKPPESAGGSGSGSGPASVMSGSSRHTRRAKSDILSLPTFVPLTIPTIDPFTDSNPFDDPTTPSTKNSVYWDAI